MSLRRKKCESCGKLIPVRRVNFILEYRQHHSEKEMLCINCQKELEDALKMVNQKNRTADPTPFNFWDAI